MSVPPHEQVGHEFKPWRTTVDAERQRRFHSAVEIDTALFGTTIDVSVLANDCLHGARPRDSLGAKRLHVGVRVCQARPIELGEELTVAAKVDAIRPDRRGRYIDVGFRFYGVDGSVPVEMAHKSLIIDSPPDTTQLRLIGKPEREEAFVILRRIAISPGMVRRYSFEFPHLPAHHDPAAAMAIGMRAPIAQGLMGFGLLFQEVVRDGMAPMFDIEAKFKRPIFWDDVLTLECAGDSVFRARNEQGKKVSELKIHDWR